MIFPTLSVISVFVYLLALLPLSYADNLNTTSFAANDAALQSLITFDEQSFFIRGERMMLFSCEIHPFRIPSPGLWLDVFQKVKALGFNTVSFYTNWALIEGTPGQVRDTGIFALEEFFKAASQSGIYLIARPGPYINAETSAGGMPGWTLRLNTTLRSYDPLYLNATEAYVSKIGRVIAAQQITKGGPVIMVQSENEYSSWPGLNRSTFPSQMNKEYIAYVNNQLRRAGIVVPLINNDPLVGGSFAPGTGLGAVDVYAVDAYPMRYDCAHPYDWPTYRWPENWYEVHRVESPSSPFSVLEMQGGSASAFGGVSQDMCNALVSEQAERVVYKQAYSFGVKLFNVYMIYGGTNWGNLGFMGVDSSYDYGAAIAEDRTITREKYSELKLQANFFRSSPAYLTSEPERSTSDLYTNTKDITVTRLADSQSDTRFYVTRHTDWATLNTTNYRLNVVCSLGNVSIPQLAGVLTLPGRDTRIHVTDYIVARNISLRYSTAEVFTWAQNKMGKTTLLLYGGADEWHEFAVSQSLGTPQILEGGNLTTGNVPPVWIVKWKVQPARQVVYFPDGKLEVHLLWRNDAYQHWVLELEAPAPISNYTSRTKDLVIVKGGYLLRSAAVRGSELRLVGDINGTTDFEVIHAPFTDLTKLTFNREELQTTRSNTTGGLKASLDWKRPVFDLPDFNKVQWRYADSLPELQPDYNDSAWTSCNHTDTTNPRKLTTPTSLYGTDYGYHGGSLLFRGHFVATGDESSLLVNIAGGQSSGHSVWIGHEFLGSWIGNSENRTYTQNFTIPPFLQEGQSYVITVLIDHMGQDEESPGTDAIKTATGILDYHLASHAQKDITWKMTGNLGGENYHDLARGPRNEGAMFAERQGFHLPYPPRQNWTKASPMADGLLRPGVGFYSAEFELNIPLGYDIPLSVLITKASGHTVGIHRVQVFVNGYQFGKYISNLGPQDAFRVPEGILNYNGTNFVGLTLWSLEPRGARLGNLQLWNERMPVQSGYTKPDLAPQPRWERRNNAY